MRLDSALAYLIVGLAVVYLGRNSLAAIHRKRLRTASGVDAPCPPPAIRNTGCGTGCAGCTLAKSPAAARTV
jgi:hypothetical protein